MTETILIAAPTAKAKNYCAEKWLLNLSKLKYPWFKVLLVDNTPDNGENAAHLQKLAADLCVPFDITVAYDGDAKNQTLMQRMCNGHNAVREVFLRGGYKHLLHLETDVMPEPNVIETLLAHKKRVVGAMYYRDEGRSRKLMIQRFVHQAHDAFIGTNFMPQDDVCFIDGTIKKVASVGLGCTLIHRSVLEKFNFRYRKGIDAAPDTYFSEDCFRFGIGIYADTSLVCEHENKAWGNYGVDYE